MLQNLLEPQRKFPICIHRHIFCIQYIPLHSWFCSNISPTSYFWICFFSLSLLWHLSFSVILNYTSWWHFQKLPGMRRSYKTCEGCLFANPDLRQNRRRQPARRPAAWKNRLFSSEELFFATLLEANCSCNHANFSWWCKVCEDWEHGAQSGAG